MRKAALASLPAVLAAAAAVCVFLALSRGAGERVVFVDVEAVVAAEKKRIFSRALRGKLSGEEAEEMAGRFLSRFGEVLRGYGERGGVVLEAGSVLSGGRDVTEEVIGKLAEGEDGE